MKKVFQSMFLVLCLSMIGSHSFAVPQPVYDEEIAVADATDPVDPEYERSLFPTCQAYLSQGELEVNFNKYIGKATVVLVNQAGVVVSSATADSEYEFAATLPVPVGKGVYSLQIMGSTGYIGLGSFSIN